MNQDALTIADRAQFGLIASALGAVVGTLAAVVVLGIFAWLGFLHPFNRWMVGFSITFFFVVGFVRGCEAADTITESLTATVLLALSALGVAGGGMTTVDQHPKWRSSQWWTIFYFTGLGLLAWFA